MKIKAKTLFNIGDEIIVPHKSKPGYYYREKIKSIRIVVGDETFFTNKRYTSIQYCTSVGDYYEEEVMTKEQFNEKQRANKRDYSSYLAWLNKQDYIK